MSTPGSLPRTSPAHKARRASQRRLAALRAMRKQAAKSKLDWKNVLDPVKPLTAVSPNGDGVYEVVEYANGGAGWTLKKPGASSGIRGGRFRTLNSAIKDAEKHAFGKGRWSRRRAALREASRWNLSWVKSNHTNGLLVTLFCRSRVSSLNQVEVDNHFGRLRMAVREAGRVAWVKPTSDFTLGANGNEVVLSVGFLTDPFDMDAVAAAVKKVGFKPA